MTCTLSTNGDYKGVKVSHCEFMTVDSKLLICASQLCFTLHDAQTGYVFKVHTHIGAPVAHVWRAPWLTRVGAGAQSA